MIASPTNCTSAVSSEHASCRISKLPGRRQGLDSLRSHSESHGAFTPRAEIASRMEVLLRGREMAVLVLGGHDAVYPDILMCGLNTSKPASETCRFQAFCDVTLVRCLPAIGGEFRRYT